MTLARWEPLTEMETLRNSIDRVFEDRFWPRIWRQEGSEMFALNVYETDSEVVVKAALPGVRLEDVDITVEQGHLTIRARRGEQAEHENAHWLHHEFGAVEYTRSVILPAGLKEAQGEAAFENGVLTLKVPKAEEARPRQIKIKTSK